MASAPTIPIYQLSGDHAGEELELLFTPPQFYALATSVSFVLGDFRSQHDEGARRIVAGFERAVAGKRDEMLALFAWYCAVATEHALLHGNDAWEASPEEFHPDARIFLARMFLAEPVLNSSLAGLYTTLFVLLESLISRAGSQLAEEGAARRLVMALPRLAMRPLKPAYARAFDPDIAYAAKERIDRLLEYCHRVESAGLQFCFCRPNHIKELPNLAQYL